MGVIREQFKFYSVIMTYKLEKESGKVKFYVPQKTTFIIFLEFYSCVCN